MRSVLSTGQPGGEIGFKVWADPCSGLVRSRGQPRERTSTWFRGPWMGPAESSGKLGGTARFARIGEPNFAEAFIAKETLRRTRARTDSEPGQPGSRGVHTTNFWPGQPGQKSVDATNSPVVQPAGESVFRGARRAGNRAAGESKRRTRTHGALWGRGRRRDELIGRATV